MSFFCVKLRFKVCCGAGMDFALYESMYSEWLSGKRRESAVFLAETEVGSAVISMVSMEVPFI